MNIVKILGNTGMVALLAVPVLAAASAVHADPIHIRADNLSNPERAAAFQHKLDVAADSFCSGYTFGLNSTQNDAACRQAVRDEAMSQLSSTQREDLAQAKSTLSVAYGR
jgi:UrcA family protein